MKIEIPDEEQMQALGARLAQACTPGCQIHLQGELGAGKTTLVRGFLRALGHRGAVKSPTYTLVEPYLLATAEVYHLDLYRLADPGELEYIGLRDMLTANSICLVEWPEQGVGWLSAPDLVLSIAYLGQGREVKVDAGTPAGEAVLARLASQAEH